MLGILLANDAREVGLVLSVPLFSRDRRYGHKLMTTIDLLSKEISEFPCIDMLGPAVDGFRLERTEHLERQVAELTRSSNAVLKELRGDIIDLNRRVARASTSPHIVTDHGAGTDYGASNYTPASARWPLHAPSLPAEHDTTLNIVEKGIIEDLQCHELFKL